MEPKREQAFVGLFVIVAVGILVATGLSLSGVFASSTTRYKTYVNFAGGLEPGSAVRYAGGGNKVGRVEELRINPKDPTQMEMIFSVQPDVPVKTNTHVRILSFSPLGDNHLELVPNQEAAPAAPSGSTLAALPYTDFGALADSLNQLAPQAKQLIGTVNERAVELKVTIARVNDLLNDQNRANISASLTHVRGMLQEDRPLVHSTLVHVNDASAKLQPLIDNFQKATTQADETLKKLDGMLSDNRADIRQSIIDLRQALANANALVGTLNNTVDSNAENLDEIIDNLRHTTENLNSFTETIKTRPYTLLRDSSPKEHKPGSALPK